MNIRFDFFRLLPFILLAQTLAFAQTNETSKPESSIELKLIGRYESGVYKQSAAEIVSFDPISKRLFVVNAASGKIDVIDSRDPTRPQRLFSIDVSDIGADANSVAVKNGMVAIAVQGNEKTDLGSVAFYDTDGNRKSVVVVGSLPDAVTFTPNGRYALICNEGEPDPQYLKDPEGSLSIIDVSAGLDSIKQSDVRTADFQAFNGMEDQLRSAGVRIFSPNATAAQDFEPEWAEATSDSLTAYVCLQENNAIAEIDIPTATVKRVMPLGFKDWSAGSDWAGNGFDASDRDGGIQIRNWPVFGMFQPDSIKILEVENEVYIIGANEGDSRDYTAWSEEARVKDLRLDPLAFPNASELQRDENLGRLLVTTTMGVANGCNPSDLNGKATRDCTYNALYAFGGRSMGIWKVTPTGLELVFDTGSQMEETIAQVYPEFFNADHEDRPRQLDRRSPSKGPEPEGLAVGTIKGRSYAFVGLERMSGIMVYDVTVPTDTRFVQYINTRDFSIAENPEADHTRSDLGPEGLYFIPENESPDAAGRPLLVVGNEVSGTTAIFAIEPIKH